MAITTYSKLQEAVANFLHRDDLGNEIRDFIQLTEADLKVRAKLPQFDISATFSMTNGSGSLPSDFARAISVTYGAGLYTLGFESQTRFDDMAAAGEVGSPVYYTIRAGTLLVVPAYTGDLTLNYSAQFAELSDSAPTNSLLVLFPDAYLNGALMHAANWTMDNESLTKHTALFEAAVRRIRTYMLDFKYPQGLQMKVA